MSFVIPGLNKPAPYLIRGNPVFFWIPAFAGMTCTLAINDYASLYITIFLHRSILTPLVRNLEEELVLVGKEIETIICLKSREVPCAE